MSDQQEQDRVLVVTPIIFKEISGTIYGVYGYFSPEAKETAREKIRRLLTKEPESKMRNKVARII